MKIVSRFLLTGTSLCILSTVALAADPKADVLAAMKAQNDAPAYRMTMSSADTNTNASTSIILESVKPDGMHLKSVAGGKVAMEMMTDGKRTLMSQAGGELQEAPPAVAAMITQAKQTATMEAMIGQAKDIKMVGHETVNGTPTSVYTFATDMMGINSTNKLWVSDKDHRPLKSEGEGHGEMAGQKVDQKVTVAYDYDPSIKIVLPPAK